jgi:glutamate racemase
MTRILVFDSGVGGLSIADAIIAAGLPVELDYLADNAWLPYGERSAESLRARVPALLAAAAEALQSDLVVIACNTASTIALDAVRAVIAKPIVGVVPPIKPAAAATTSGVIGLLATPATVATPYVDDLIARFAAGVAVVRRGSSALVLAAEAKLSGEALQQTLVANELARLFGAPGGDRIDVVALACTHFPLLHAELASAAPRPVLWLDSGAAIARRIADVLGLHAGGEARVRRACFTDAAAAPHQAAFASRGFDAFVSIGAAPHFSVTLDAALSLAKPAIGA